MSELPEPWKTAGDRKGLGSYRAIARASGTAVETVRKVIRGERRPNVETSAKLAAAFGVESRTIDEWAGMITRESSAEYTPPAEAQRLNMRQRKALDEIIRSMVHTPFPGEQERTIVPEIVTAGPNAYELAANRGQSQGRKLAAEADRRGEESQDPQD